MNGILPIIEQIRTMLLIFVFDYRNMSLVSSRVSIVSLKGMRMVRDSTCYVGSSACVRCGVGGRSARGQPEVVCGQLTCAVSCGGCVSVQRDRRAGSRPAAVACWRPDGAG